MTGEPGREAWERKRDARKVPGTVASSFGISLVIKSLGYTFRLLIGIWGHLHQASQFKGRHIVLRVSYFGERRPRSLSVHAGKAHGFIHEYK